jgi:L-threonylcarbamoyladenylate synthase
VTRGRLVTVEDAVAAVAAGGVIGLPTETVYGLAADAGNRAAVASIYRIKGRPPDHPLIVHVLDAAQARQWAEWTPAAQRLADAFWPGPLTIVLRRRPEAPPWAGAGHPTIALRCPAHPVARTVMTQLLGLGISGLAAPSANRFGRVSPTRAAHVRADLGDEVPIVLEGGDAQVGVESTIVDLSRGRPHLLRPGHVGAAALAAVLGEPVAAADDEAPRVPGSLASHYAPVKPLRVIPLPDLDAALAQALAAGQRIAVWSVDPPRVAQPAGVDWLARPVSADAMEHDLYRVMRELDAGSTDLILIEAPPTGDAWEAVNDRLQRAATPRE